MEVSNPSMIAAALPPNAVSGLFEMEIQQAPNPDLKWETTASFNVGLELGLFDDCLTLDVDYYLEKEWKKEFYGEGQLFFWYKRNKKTEMQSATDQYGTVSVKLSNYVLPIPDAESQYN